MMSTSDSNPRPVKKPRMPRNPDDDAAMERYLQRLAAYEAAQDERATAKVKVASGAKDGGDLEGLKACVRQVCENLAAGQCAEKATKAHVFIGGADLKKKGSSRILLESIRYPMPSCSKSFAVARMGSRTICCSSTMEPPSTPLVASRR